MSGDVSFDEELLQITEKKGTIAVKKPPKKARREEDSEEEVSGGESDDKKDKKKNKSSESKKPLKKRQKTESDEEARNGTDSSDDDVFHDGYDEDLIGDDEDRERLSQLPEIEREAILGERYERRKELKEQWEVKRMLKSRTRSSKEKEKEREKRDRSKKKQEKKGKALSDLKKMRARMAKDEEEEEEEEGEEQTEGDKEEDEDYADEPTKETRATSRQERDERSSDDEEPERDALDNRPMTLEELNSVRLPRESLIKWLNKPFFETLVPGFFVRIGIGPDPTTHTSVYRVAQIEAVKKGKHLYTLPGADGLTDKVLQLRIAAKDKECRMETISNRSFSPQEFQKWLSEMNKVKKELPTAAWAKAQAKTLRRANDYKYTAEDIEKLLQAKREKGQLPFKIAAEKARLIALRDAAKEEDMAEFVRLSDEIARLEELGKEKYDTLNKISKATTIANINSRNKQANFDKTKSSENKEERLNNELDPFSRRKTLPRVLLARPKKGAEEVPPPEEEKKPATSASNGHSNNNNSNRLNTSTDRIPAKGLQDEHSGINIDIPVDLVSMKIDLSSSNPLVAPPKQLASTPVAPLPIVNPTHSASTYISPASTATPAAQKLSLADYMRRRRALE